MYFTVGYNVLEDLVSVFAGLLAGSIALVGFGLDSFVESLSGGVMIWRLREHGNLAESEEEKVEKRATRWIAYTFFALAAVRHIAERLNSLLDQKVCSKTPEEELIKEMWDVASVDERKSLALVLLKLTEKS